MGHPKRLLLVSEPKIQSCREKEKADCPIPCVSAGIQVPSPRYLLEEKGRGNHRVPISPQQPRNGESPGKENEESPS